MNTKRYANSSQKIIEIAIKKFSREQSVIEAKDILYHFSWKTRTYINIHISNQNTQRKK